MFLRCVLHHVRRTTHANDRFLSMTSERFFSHKPSSQGYVALLQRAPLDRRPDGFLINRNPCKFLARSKIFLPHSCNNFHTCSIFVPRPKQIYIQQIFANIQSKLVRFEMRDIKKKRRKKIDRILIHLPGRVITRRFDVSTMSRNCPELSLSRKGRFHLQHSFPTFRIHLIRNYVPTFSRDRRFFLTSTEKGKDSRKIA